jgi:hypothetical protein
MVTALVLGWYGHKAYIRIQAWGEKMNERDAIFQSCASVEELEPTTATSRRQLFGAHLAKCRVGPKPISAALEERQLGRYPNPLYLAAEVKSQPLSNRERLAR